MVCPYLDRGDRRCTDKLKLCNLDQAISQCADSFAECPTFHRIYSRDQFSLKRLVLRTLHLI